MSQGGTTQGATMDRSAIEIDLPSRVAAYLAPSLDAWLDKATTGDRLRVSVTADVTAPLPLAHPAVITNDQARDVIELRLVDLMGVSRPMYLVEAASKADGRLIERLEERLTPPRPQLDTIDDAGPVPNRAWYGYASGFGSF